MAISKMSRAYLYANILCRIVVLALTLCRRCMYNTLEWIFLFVSLALYFHFVTQCGATLDVQEQNLGNVLCLVQNHYFCLPCYVTLYWHYLVYTLFLLNTPCMWSYIVYKSTISKKKNKSDDTSVMVTNCMCCIYVLWPWMKDCFPFSGLSWNQPACNSDRLQASRVSPIHHLLHCF